MMEEGGRLRCCWTLSNPMLFVMSSLLIYCNILLVHLSASATNNTMTFAGLRYSNGTAQCAINTASSTFKVRSTLECSVQCKQSALNCIGFNAIATNSSKTNCQLYSYVPSCYSKVTGCRYYQAPVNATRSSNYTGVNLALHRPTNISSVFSGDVGNVGIETGANAVDGNTDSTWTHWSCTETGLQSLAWWFVDLGATYQIQYVNITNRGDAVANRLIDFNVGISNHNPMVLTPNSTNYSLCVYYPGYPPLGATVTLYCLCNTLPGRYVIVQLTPASGATYLTLCEVKVFAFP